MISYNTHRMLTALKHRYIIYLRMGLYLLLILHHVARFRSAQETQ